MPPRPRLQALLLADHVYTDAATGKRIVAGTFNTLSVPNFPIQVNYPACAYISLTEVRGGGTTLTMRLVDTQNLTVVMESESLRVSASNPQETIEAGFPLPGFFFPHEGNYDFELHADGERLGCVRVTARQAPQSDASGE